jgi:predicted nucleic acid-binding protein
MSYLVDTNVLVRVVQPKNPHQVEADKALRSLRHESESLMIIAQNLIEFWAVATRPPINNGLGLTADQTATQIGNLKSLFTLLPDTPKIFSEWERIVLQHKVSGKQVHDARLVAAMSVYDLTHLLTFNTDDFKRFTTIIVVSPQTILNI